MEQEHTVGTPPPVFAGKEVIQLEAGESVTGLVIGEVFFGVPSHWRQNAGPRGRSERCTDDKGFCDGCQAELPARWRGYLEVWSLNHHRPVFVELTKGAYDTLVSQLRSRQQLRGLRVVLTRLGKGKRGRVNGVFSDPHPSEMLAVKNLPEPRDPNPILDLLFGWNRS